MILQIYKKEFYKLKWLLAGLFIVHLGYITQFIVDTNSIFNLHSPIAIWTNVVFKNAFYFDSFKFLFTITAVMIGFAQFLPEVQKRRFRIACHLPINEMLMTCYTMSFGILVFLLFSIVDIFIVIFIGQKYFPIEITNGSLEIMLYWLLGGILTFISSALITIEPSWYRRFVLFIIIIQVVSLSSIVKVYGSELTFLPFLFLLLLFIPFSIFPALRFRRGAGI